jgi:CRP-like cAMP-binding protein
MTDCRVLSGAGVQTLADLAGVSRERAFAAGEVTLPRGGDRAHLQVVIDGAIHGEREDPLVARDYGPADVVLGAASFGRTASAWKATAVVPTRVLEIPVEAWFDLMEDHFDLMRSALAALALRRDAVLEQLANETDGLILT